MKKRNRLRELIQGPEILVTPGAYDALSAKLIEAVGFEAVYMSGFATAASSFGLPDDAFVLGCTAAYRPRKGIEYLIDALGMLPPDIPAHLLLIGRMDSNKLTKKIESSPAAGRIHRIGHRTDAPAVTAACDVFSLPSTKREGLARAIIEAMAYRVPSVVTDCGGSPELVVDGECGYVVPIKDARALAGAFEKLYRDPELRRHMGDAARERIGTHFRNEDTVRKTIALYEELVPNPD